MKPSQCLFLPMSSVTRKAEFEYFALVMMCYLADNGNQFKEINREELAEWMAETVEKIKRPIEVNPIQKTAYAHLSNPICGISRLYEDGTLIEAFDQIRPYLASAEQAAKFSPTWKLAMLLAKQTEVQS